MRFIQYLLIALFSFSCSLEKSMNNAEFDAVIAKLGDSPEKNSVEENVMVGDAYRKSNRLVESIPFYEAAIKEGGAPEETNLYLAQGLKVQQNYVEAERILNNYLPRARDEKTKKFAEKELENLRKIDDLKEKESYYRVKNLEDINTEKAEYSPVFSQNYLYFTSNREGGKIYRTTGTPFTDIYRVASRGANVNLSTLDALDPIINHVDTNEGSVAISPDGSSMIFAKGNDGKAKGYSEVNLFFTRYRNGRWSEPVPLSINVAEAWDSTPAFSPDGTTLYFSSTRPGGYGGADLYQAKVNRRGRWVDVRNLGPEINTPGDEMFPYISEDGSLYFSSDGHAGFGKLDMFRAVREGGHVTVTNLGKPMNSSADDFGLFQYNLTRGFFTSNRRGGKGDDDIYTFINDDPDLKVVNYFLTGVTMTTDDGGEEIVLPNTKVSLTADNGDVLDEAFTGADGKFNFRVYPEEHYDLIGEKTDYFTVRKDFTTVGKTVNRDTLTEFITNVTFETNIMMDPIVLEKAIVLDNIYYDLDKANIRPDAALVLDSLVQIMNDNPEIYIELGSHTDSRADDDYNMKLSQRRAQSAVSYIINEGIESDRIVAKGYGETQLLIKNAKTEAEHQKNRRTEFKVLRYNPRNRNDDLPPDEPVDEYDRFFKDSGDGNG
ncbi:OmpA family protein [Ekhidna sp.]|jgi:peptidoglycan-associated lipoprotein|uniref:OmpA family protein n=1 Tax=Ekhidna sp. TaxID=2608089 RepID=UPI0032EB9C5D